MTVPRLLFCVLMIPILAVVIATLWIVLTALGGAYKSDYGERKEGGDDA